MNNSDLQQSVKGLWVHLLFGRIGESSEREVSLVQVGSHQLTTESSLTHWSVELGLVKVVCHSV